MSGECEIYCDLDAMEELGSQLDSIHASLDDVGEHVDVFDARLGSPRLEHAIDKFVSGWRDGRKEIRKGVEAVAANARKGAEAYRATEEKLTSAHRGEPAG